MSTLVILKNMMTFLNRAPISGEESGSMEECKRLVNQLGEAEALRLQKQAESDKTAKTKRGRAEVPPSK